MAKKEKEERMDGYFSVFNLHVNKAGKRADKEFKAQFGKKIFNKEIAPLQEKDIMSIFDKEPTMYTMVWVSLVTAYANETVK